MWEAHCVAKRTLVELVAARTQRRLQPDALTLGFARRATAYKRHTLVFSDLSVLRRIARRPPLQIVLAGKAHHKDDPGKAAIRSALRAAREFAFSPNTT